MISVIIPLYNKERTIRQTINSVLMQTYTDFEIVVVSDGSTDRSVEIVKSINDDRIRLFQKENNGVSSARNYGIENSKGDFVFFLDADDIIYNTCLSVLMETSNIYSYVDIIVANYYYVSNGNKKIASIHERGVVSDMLRAFYNETISLRTGTMLFKKYVFENVKFDIRMSVHEDTDMWIRLMKNNTFAYTPAIIHEYIMDESFLSIKKIDIKREFAYYIDLSTSRNSKYERLIKGNNLVCSIVNRIFKKDYATVFYLLRKNFRYICFLLQIYYYRKMKIRK